MAITLSTIVLHFEGNAPDNYYVTTELDEVLNEDKTSFANLETAYFLVKHSSNVIINRASATHGDVYYNGTVTRPRSNTCLFVETNSEENKPKLSYEPVSTPSIYWYGNTGGAVHLDRSELSLDIHSGTVPCFALAEYSVIFKSYRLVPAPITFREGEDNFNIHVVLYLSEVT